MANILVFSGGPSDESKALGLTLEFAGHSCTTVYSVHETIRLLRNRSFDLVLTCLELNHTILKSIVETLTKASPRTPVLILSERKETAVELDDVVTIPCPPEDLFQRIKDAVERPREAEVALERAFSKIPKHFRERFLVSHAK